MDKERYNQIIDEVYEKYHQENKNVMYLTFLLKEDFINKCKTDTEFSEKWGLKIEERELSLEERNKWSWDNWGITCEMESVLDEQELPKRAITLTYKNEKIEIYE
jgi:hypothetical protein